MNKRIKRICLVALMVVFALGILAGCTLGDTKDGVIEEFNLVAKINYHANGGDFGGDGITLKEIYFQEGARPLNIAGEGVNLTSGTLKIERSKYTFEGWFEPLKDANGNFLTKAGEAVKVDGSGYLMNANGEYILNAKGNKQTIDSVEIQIDKTKPLDDKYRLKSGDEFTYFAYWLTEIKVEIRLVTEDGKAVVVEGKKNQPDRTIESGGVFSEISFDINAQVIKPEYKLNDKKSDINKVVGGTHTWAGKFFTDKACTTEASWPIKNEGQTENIVVYTYFVTGNWYFISTKQMFKEYFNQSALDPTLKGTMSEDIDFENEIFSISYLNGELHGNNHVVKNFRVQMSENGSMKNGTTLSMIGGVSATGMLKDITFENVTVTAIGPTPLSGKHSINVYALIAETQEGARFENVNVNGLAVNVSLNPEKAYVENMQKIDGDYVKTNVLFGGFDTDDKFFEKYTGFVVDKDKFTVTVTETN